MGFKADYITVSNSKTLNPAAEDDLEITILGAMFNSGARLIDNCSISLIIREISSEYCWCYLHLVQAKLHMAKLPAGALVRRFLCH